MLALGVPLVLYCDPEQTPLEASFAKELEGAVWWCRTAAELDAAVGRLVSDGHVFLDEVGARNAETWLRDYAVGRGDGLACNRALSVLATARGACGGVG